MIILGHLDAAPALQFTTVIAAVGVIVAALEDLSSIQHFSDNGILSWEIIQLESRWSATGRRAAIAHYFLSFPRFKHVLMARLVSASVLAVLGLFGIVVPLLLFLVLLSTLTLSIRSFYGQDGAQQMNLVVFGALFLSALVPPNGVARTSCLWFIGLQAGLSYLISGANKAISSRWRDGTGLVGVLGTSIYGHRSAYTFLSDRPVLAGILSWTVIVFECGFCTVFLVGYKYQLAILAAGALFHASTAILMGLNGFFFAWLATYPAVLYIAGGLRHL